MNESKHSRHFYILYFNFVELFWGIYDQTKSLPTDKRQKLCHVVLFSVRSFLVTSCDSHCDITKSEILLSKLEFIVIEIRLH